MKTEIGYDEEIYFRAKDQLIAGNLTIPKNARSIIIFCHGMNSSRHSPRNRYVAKVFNSYGIATLLLSLENIEEDLFLKGLNLNLLTDRLADITKGVMNESLTRKLSIGYFGSGTGAAVALAASIKLNGIIKAIVCRDSRPDAAVELLEKVNTPALLICGEKDKEGIAINEMAKQYLKSNCTLKVISGASYLFEESGKLDEVALISMEWFRQYLAPPAKQD